MTIPIGIGIIIRVGRHRLTREESQARTRSEVLAAAAQVFARRGYDGASVAEIADEAGYSHGAVYSNFADKEDLFLALYEEWVAARVREIGALAAVDTTVARDQRPGAEVEAGSTAARVRAGVEEWVTHLAADPDAFMLRLEFTVRAARDPTLRSKLGTRVGAVPLALQRVTERAARGEGLEFVLPPEQVALALQSLCLGLALEALATPDAVRPAVAGELGARLIGALTEREDPRGMGNE
jgi:AcrR family transcriptional regulator